MDETLEQKIRSCRTLPTLPAAALRLLAASRSPGIDLVGMASALHEDPALAARVVRAANVAAMGWGEVSTLPRAVNLLGANRVLCVSLTFSLVGIRRGGEVDGFDHGAFWRRALYSGIAARALAEGHRIDPEEAFLAGLLQDIGMLALAETLGPRYGAVVRDSRGDHLRLAELEATRLRGTHAEVTWLLAQSWSLPAGLQEAVLKSHQPAPPVGSPADMRLGDCVQLSGLLAEVWTCSRPADALTQALLGCRTQVGLSRDGFSVLLARASRLIPEVAADLEVQLAGEAHRARVLAEARLALNVARGRGELPESLEPLAQPEAEAEG